MFDLLIKYCSDFEKVASKLAPEAPKSAPFGRYAWSKYREGIPEEEETDVEKFIYKELQNHFGDYNNKRKGISAATAYLLQLILAKGWYKKIIHEPPAKTLYRGLTLNRKQLAKYLDIEPDQLDIINKLDFENRTSIPVIKGYSTSWTFKKQITKDFSNKKDSNSYAVTLIAETKDNPNKFIAGPGGLYDVEGISSFHLEKETVGLEPIKIKKVEWIKL